MRGRKACGRAGGTREGASEAEERRANLPAGEREKLKNFGNSLFPVPSFNVYSARYTCNE